MFRKSVKHLIVGIIVMLAKPQVQWCDDSVWLQAVSDCNQKGLVWSTCPQGTPPAVQVFPWHKNEEFAVVRGEFGKYLITVSDACNNSASIEVVLPNTCGL